LCVDEIADLGQTLAESRQTREVALLVFFDPERMVAILPAAAGIATDGLNVRVCFRGDVNVRPCRRYSHGLDALQNADVPNDAASPITIRKTAPAGYAPNRQFSRVSVGYLAGPTVIRIHSRSIRRSSHNGLTRRDVPPGLIRGGSLRWLAGAIR
jgi:hypothetical protein